VGGGVWVWVWVADKCLGSWAGAYCRTCRDGRMGRTELVGEVVVLMLLAWLAVVFKLLLAAGMTVAMFVLSCL
jgi:hypothetical protein